MSDNLTFNLKAPNQDTIYILSLIEQVIGNLVDTELRRLVNSGLLSSLEALRSEDTKYPQFRMKPKDNVCNVIFSYQREHRKLFIWFNKEEQEVYFNLGNWGQAELYMNLLKDKFVEEGFDIYYDVDK